MNKKITVILAFTLPIALIGVVMLSTYLPSRFVSTNYDFLYTACANSPRGHTYRCYTDYIKRYSVSNNKLLISEIEKKDNQPPYVASEDATRIFFYDTEKGESREISLKEAKKLKLNGLLTSPDGVSISSQHDSGVNTFLFFSSGSTYHTYLTKGRHKKKINTTDPGKYYSNFHFVGWVIPE